MLITKRVPAHREAAKAPLSIHLTNPWHAVSVRGPSSACPAATSLGKRRFLSREAPPLPLPECSCANRCRCTYQHHDDRRGFARRAADEGRPAPYYPGTDRRRALGRRKTDLP